jgi:hypothetical protein
MHVARKILLRSDVNRDAKLIDEEWMETDGWIDRERKLFVVFSVSMFADLSLSITLQRQ